jgi:transaldolase/glucose-6-phosphate isomerase
LIGIDVSQMLDCAAWKASECGVNQPYGRNPGLVWGTVIGEAALHGKDKLTFISDAEVASFGTWLEQLVAESSGKQGKGILPVNGETPTEPEKYGEDRIFVYLRRTGKFDSRVKQLRKAGHPVLIQDFLDNYALGSEFFKWEFAIATACSIIHVNAFDQPDVQDSKNRTVAKISYYKENQSFSENKPAIKDHGISLYGNISPDGTQVPGIIKDFLRSAQPDDYVAINAYLMRDPKNNSALQHLRMWIRDRTHLATMLGFGPRFQHSTGQLHKGGENNGLFLVITTDPKKDLDIPNEGLSFGTLEHGQALGDMEALQARGRRVLRIHLSNPDLLSTLVRQLTET